MKSGCPHTWQRVEVDEIAISTHATTSAPIMVFDTSLPFPDTAVAVILGVNWMLGWDTPTGLDSYAFATSAEKGEAEKLCTTLVGGAYSGSVDWTRNKKKVVYCKP